MSVGAFFFCIAALILGLDAVDLLKGDVKWVEMAGQGAVMLGFALGFLCAVAIVGAVILLFMWLLKEQGG